MRWPTRDSPTVMGSSEQPSSERSRQKKLRRKQKRLRIERWRSIPRSRKRQTSLATVRFNYNWDWAAAESGFRRAIELNPGYATAHQRYSLYLIARGRTQESIEEMKRALWLDPLSISMNFSLGWRLYMARRYDEAIQQLRNASDMDSGFILAHLVLGQAYEQKGQFRLAIAELDKAVALSQRSAPTLAALAHVYAASGNRAAARKLLAELKVQSRRQYVSPFYIALAYEGLGEQAQSIAWLRKAFEDRSNPVIFLKVDPQFDSLRLNPQFLAVVSKLS